MPNISCSLPTLPPAARALRAPGPGRTRGPWTKSRRPTVSLLPVRRRGGGGPPTRQPRPGSGTHGLLGEYPRPCDTSMPAHAGCNSSTTTLRYPATGGSVNGAAGAPSRHEHDTLPGPWWTASGLVRPGVSARGGVRRARGALRPCETAAASGPAACTGSSACAARPPARPVTSSIVAELHQRQLGHRGCLGQGKLSRSPSLIERGGVRDLTIPAWFAPPPPPSTSTATHEPAGPLNQSRNMAGAPAGSWAFTALLLVALGLGGAAAGRSAPSSGQMGAVSGASLLRAARRSHSLRSRHMLAQARTHAPQPPPRPLASCCRSSHGAVSDAAEPAVPWVSAVPQLPSLLLACRRAPARPVGSGCLRKAPPTAPVPWAPLRPARSDCRGCAEAVWAAHAAHACIVAARAAARCRCPGLTHVFGTVLASIQLCP